MSVTVGGILLIADDGPSIGLGHLHRMRFLRNELRQRVELPLRLISRQGASKGTGGKQSTAAFATYLEHVITRTQPSLCVFDIDVDLWEADWSRIARALPNSTKTIGVDVPFHWADYFDTLIHPCVSPPTPNLLAGRSNWGPEWVLVNKLPRWDASNHSGKVTVLTGSQGFDQYFGTINTELGEIARSGNKVAWVVGAFKDRSIASLNRQSTTIRYVSDRNLPTRMSRSNLAIARFGVTVLELTARGVPTIVLPGWTEAEHGEVRSLQDAGVIVLCEDLRALPQQARQILSSEELQRNISERALRFFQREGSHPAVDAILNPKGKETSPARGNR